MKIEDIKTPDQFIDVWKRMVAWRITADGKKNWKGIETWKKMLVELWHKSFQDEIQAIVANNFKPENWENFYDFAYHPNNPPKYETT